MLKKKKESVNYLDQIPRISIPKWEVLEDGLVEVTVENKGFFNVIAQKCFHRPRTSYIKLDEYGSCVFQQIDGEKSIYEIGQILEQTHEGLPFSTNYANSKHSTKQHLVELCRPRRIF